MTIKGEATIDFGEISNVTLKVGGKAISEVTAVPLAMIIHLKLTKLKEH